MSKGKQKIIEKLGAWQHHRKLQYMIALSFTLITVVGMLALGIMLYATYTRNAEELVVEDNSKLVAQVELNLTNYLRNMMRISDTAYYSVIKNIDFAKTGADKELTLLYEANRDNLVSIACFTNTGKLVVATPVNTFKQDVNVTTQDWFVRAQRTPENLHFSSSHVQHIFEDSNDRYYWVLSLSRSVELTNNGSISNGILLVDMNFSGIKHLFTKVNSGNISYMYLVDGNGEIIYHPRQNLIFSNLYQENNIVAAEYEDGVHEEEFLNTKRTVVVKTVGYTGWKIISVIPEENMQQQWNQASFIWVTILAISILILIFANQYLSAKIVQPLRKLEDSVKELELHYPEKIYVGGSEEIQHLGMTIRSMVEQMRKLMDDIVKQQEEKRRNELDALQSQINPHFLYNTLDSIIWMVESERYEEAISMVTALANLFRISLSQGRTIITIKEEFNHARNYSNIQQVRFKNKFSVAFMLDEKIEKYLTIKLIIQPLLENAIYYGMEAMDGDGEILVQGYEQDDAIYIDVIDNGIGIPPETVEHLLTDGKYERKRGSGIGLKNVDQRIKLYFGEEYGLEIKSEPDVGTRVRIRLPKKLEVEDEK
ncbi:MAG: sensor histidine kinase [Lachnospiraceae bacterium]|nr:sensor histidine kinase [Lachnospiraceae bacterium]